MNYLWWYYYYLSMTFICDLKKLSDTVHYYPGKSERVNEKPNVVMNICLGTDDKIIQENMGVEEKEIVKILKIYALVPN